MWFLATQLFIEVLFDINITWHFRFLWVTWYVYALSLWH